MDNDNKGPSWEYDGNELVKVIEDQRNVALTQAAQLSAIVTRLTGENKMLQKQLDDLRGQDVDVKKENQP